MLSPLQAERVARMSPEQRRRVELLQAYMAETGPAREERARRIRELLDAQHEKKIRYFSEFDSRRGELISQYMREGQPLRMAQSRAAIHLAMEYDRILEGCYTEQRDLEKDLPTLTTWTQWLEARRDDPMARQLLEEAKKMAIPEEVRIEGWRLMPPPPRVLTDIVPRLRQDDGVDYCRGVRVVLTEWDDRLDVRSADTPDLEAALRLAMQKYDINEGLMLSGSTALKCQMAEIAGRMGIKINNLEPEVILAWQKGLEQFQGAELGFDRVPTVDLSISGTSRHQEPVITLQASQAEIQAAQELTPDGATPLVWASMAHGTAPTLPVPEWIKALEVVRGLDAATRQAMREALMRREPVPQAHREVLVSQALAREDGLLTPMGSMMVLVDADDELRRRRIQERAQGVREVLHQGRDGAVERDRGAETVAHEHTIEPDREAREQERARERQRQRRRDRDQGLEL